MDQATPDTASIYEAAGKRGALDPGIRPVWPGARISGKARTLSVPPGENLSLHMVLPSLADGDVLVVDAGGATHIAIWGEVMAVAAQAQGCAGLVVDGAVRDSDAMARCGFPVFALGIAIPGPGKDKAGEADIPVTVGGCAIHPGDWIVGDSDGVVAIPRAEASKVRSAALERQAWEGALMADLRDGRTTTMEALGLAPA